MKVFKAALQHEAPYVGRLSRRVPWEGRGEIPLPDPIGGNAVRQKTLKRNCI